MQERLRFEFSRLQDSTSTGLLDSYPDLGTSTGTNEYGAPIYDVTRFITEPDKTAFSFGLETDDEEAQLQLSSDPFIRSVSTNIEAFGALYTYISDWLITHPQSGLNVILVHITDMVCEASRGDWVIEYENIAWCDDGQCKLNITLTEYTPKLNCMLSTFITDNWNGWFPPDGFMSAPNASMLVDTLRMNGSDDSCNCASSSSVSKPNEKAVLSGSVINLVTSYIGAPYSFVPVDVPKSG